MFLKPKENDTNNEMKNWGLDVCDEIAENAKAAQRLS